MNGHVRHFALWSASLLKRDRKGKILFYHDVHKDVKYDVTSTPIELFKSHVTALQENRFMPVTCLPQGDGQAMICFDDGLRGIWDCRDFFFEKGIKPTVFLISGKIGCQGYLAKDEILELKRRGFTFQSHGVTHRSLTDISSESEISRELVESKAALEALLGEEVTGFCYPRGMMSKRIRELTRLAGYKELYSSIPGNAAEPLEEGLYCRNLSQSLTKREFGWVLRGAMGVFKNRYIKRQAGGGL